MTRFLANGHVRTMADWPDAAILQQLARAGGPALEAVRDEARERLAEIANELREWRGLAYNASQQGNARSFGRCQRNIESLELRETHFQRSLGD